MTRPTILIAEDDDNDVLLLKNLLNEFHITNPIQVVYDGEDAIAYLKGERIYADRQKHPLPFLLLLDVRMPRKGAVEVLSWLKNQPNRSSIVVIVLTAFNELAVMNQAYVLGPRSFLPKPINKADFKSVICSIKGVEIEG